LAETEAERTARVKANLERLAAENDAARWAEEEAKQKKEKTNGDA
jgi:hypothetical protein